VSRVTPAAVEPRQASVVTPAAEVGGDPTAVMEVALMACQLMEYRLGGTSMEHHQYYHQKVLTQPCFSSPLLLLPIKLCRYHLGQLRYSQGC
jgi:hypothetical protein